ncbi:MAG TPA: FAD-dependent tricarballylate dehydrogenase TcuA [Streptosporangiaceae bacterium]|jgi:tricarballylate dehydrogenase
MVRDPAGTAADVIVVGGGNAGLCAALAAREVVERVLLLEKAPTVKRGGNSALSGGRFRVPHGDLADVAAIVGKDPAELANVDMQPYTEDDFRDDLLAMSHQRCDPELTELIVGQARGGIDWLKSMGARFELPFGMDEVKQGEKIRFMGGDDIQHYESGAGLVNNLYRQAADRGIVMHYGCAATGLLTESGAISGVLARTAEGELRLTAPAVVLACGGFEASAQMRAQYLGRGWDLAKVRGTEFNTGDGLNMAIEAGVRTNGNWSGCHAVAWDYLAPETGDWQHPDVHQRYSYRLGITVNRHGQRFFDEGEALRAYTYASLGEKIIGQPGAYAVQIFDAKVMDLARGGYRWRTATKVVADDLGTIARELDVDPKGLAQTVAEYNASIHHDEVDFTGVDGRGTAGIQPAKSNWAMRIDKPPYSGFAVGAGITFTFGGLQANSRGELLDDYRRPVPGLYAAGELVGGIFYHNYPGGSGLVSGLVLGRRAGQAAAERAVAIAKSGPR